MTNSKQATKEAAADWPSLTAEAWLLVLLGGPCRKTARGPSCQPSLWFGGLWPKGATGSSASEQARSQGSRQHKRSRMENKRHANCTYSKTNTTETPKADAQTCRLRKHGRTLLWQKSFVKPSGFKEGKPYRKIYRRRQYDNSDRRTDKKTGEKAQASEEETAEDERPPRQRKRKTGRTPPWQKDCEAIGVSSQKQRWQEEAAEEQ